MVYKSRKPVGRKVTRMWKSSLRYTDCDRRNCCLDLPTGELELLIGRMEEARLPEHWDDPKWLSDYKKSMEKHIEEYTAYCDGRLGWCSEAVRIRYREFCDCLLLRVTQITTRPRCRMLAKFDKYFE